MKTTLATIKTFISKNKDQLYIKNKSDFDGMVDCVMPCNGGFRRVEFNGNNIDNTLGINGAWFVKQSRDAFRAVIDGNFKGYEVYNCCGSFILAIKAL